MTYQIYVDFRKLVGNLREWPTNITKEMKAMQVRKELACHSGLPAHQFGRSIGHLKKRTEEHS
jgi:hypothetical protein